MKLFIFKLLKENNTFLIKHHLIEQHFFFERNISPTSKLASLFEINRVL